MATEAPPMQATPQQVEQMRQAMQAEAKKRGMTFEEFQAQQKAAIEKEAAAAGLSPQEFIAQLRARAFADMQRKQQAAQQQQEGQIDPNSPTSPEAAQPQQQRIPVNTSGTPDPKALALAQWLRGQDLKTRTCILSGQRKDMFRG